MSFRQPLLAVMVSLLAACGTQTEQAPGVTTVAQVDLTRYLGKWYEIGNFPMYFQRNCIGDTTAEYAALPDGAISVTNRCRTENGFEQAEGKATVVKDSGNARLKVSFFWPFRADYWIIGLDPDYRWAVVGNPERKYLWILSRSPQLPPEQLTAAKRAAEAQGYPLGMLRLTPQSDARR